ncbi:Protein HID1 [Candida viswanathii]|uniref:Protein HID1 n=1 Tax=Candida viswanathii TaxID=5486 RepID=A0A367XUA5_9ASCO|nr:Protein HID1 [Candida viswanathii]
MKTSEERARFRNHFLKLSQGHVIPIDGKNNAFWNRFWQEPTCSNDIYEVITAEDIKKVRHQNLMNIIQFVQKLCNRIIYFAKESPTLGIKNKENVELLNCIRFLNRLLPFIFELDNYNNDLEIEIFWNNEFDPIVCLRRVQQVLHSDEEDYEPEKPQIKTEHIPSCIAVKLISSLVDLLFIENFTVSTGKPQTAGKRSLSVWEPGIGNSSKYQEPNLIIDSNRSEVLRLLITLCSTAFYESISNVITQGSKFLSLLVSVTPRIELLTLVSSLLNLSCRSSRSSPVESGLAFDQIEYREVRHLCTSYSFQLLTLMIVYPLPQKSELKFLTDAGLVAKPYNMARVYMGKIHKENELLFIASSLINVLRAPLVNARDQELDAFAILKPGSGGNKPSLWSLEAAMLIWELLQSNKNFVAIIGKKYILELMVILLYYVFAYNGKAQYKNLVFVCAYLLLYLSSSQEDGLLELLFKPLAASPSQLDFYNALPSNYKLSITPITARDFLVSQICNILLNDASCSSQAPASSYISNSAPLPELLLKTMIEILYNLIPPVSEDDNSATVTNDKAKKLNNANPRGGLSYQASSLITQVIATLSRKEFILQKAFHADIVALLVRAVSTAVLKQPAPSRMLLFCMLKNEKIYDELWNTIFSFTGVFFRGNSLTKIDDKIEEQSPVLEGESVDTQQDGDYFNTDHGDTNNSTVKAIPIPTNKYEEPLNSTMSENESIEASLRPSLPTGMSARAREKIKKDSPLGKTWPGNDSLAVILTIIIPHLKVVLNEVWSRVQGSSVDSYELVQRIAQADFSKVVEENKSQVPYDLLPDTPIDLLKFNWNHLSLGWYISLLYGQVYNTTELVKSYSGTSANNYKIVKNITSKLTLNWTSFLKLDTSNGNGSLSNINEDLEWVNNSLTNVNCWSDSNIKLFKVESTSGNSFFASLNSKLNSYGQNGNPIPVSQPYNQAVPSTPGSLNDMTRRFGDFRFNDGAGIKSVGASPLPSGLSTPIEEQEMYFQRRPYRNSVTSLHSLNTLNRSRSNTRSNTPRNSMS